MIELPWASVIIPTYGEKGVALTKKCIETLRETHGHMLPEIFVVSDGDGEPARGQLNALAPELGFNLLWIERQGFAAACNAAMRLANGAVGVFLVNNDIEFTANSLQILADCMQATRSGTIGCLLTYPDGTIQHAGVVYQPQEQGPVPGYFDHALRGEPATHYAAVSLRASLVTGALMGYNRELIERSGLLDDRFGFTCEDIDACLRSWECGLQSTYCGYTSAIHHEGASRGRTPEEKLALEPEVAEKEFKALQFLHQKWIGIDIEKAGRGVMR